MGRNAILRGVFADKFPAKKNPVEQQIISNIKVNFFINKSL
jgi:hypothetical protein